MGFGCCTGSLSTASDEVHRGQKKDRERDFERAKGTLCGLLGKFPIHVRIRALATSFILSAGFLYAMPVSPELTEQVKKLRISKKSLRELVRKPVLPGLGTNRR